MPTLYMDPDPHPAGSNRWSLTSPYGSRTKSWNSVIKGLEPEGEGGLLDLLKKIENILIIFYNYLILINGQFLVWQPRYSMYSKKEY